MKSCSSKNKKNSKQPLSHTDLAYYTGLYALEAKDVYMYRARFDRITSNESFTKEQLRNNMGILGVQATNQISDRIFAAMDKMGNGGVSFPEYLEYMSVTANGTEEQKSEQTFRFMT